MTTNSLTADKLIKHLARVERHRVSPYISSEKIERWYLQKVSQILELGTGEVLSGKLEGGLLGLLRTEAGGEKGTDSKVAIDHPIVQGIVAENVARASNTLVDLASTEPKESELCYYLGPAQITLMKETALPESSELSPAQWFTINAVRSGQETILKFVDPSAETIVLSFSANHQDFASICSLKSVDLDALSSYHSKEYFGILCTLESTRGEVAFLDPLWIWHE